MVRLSLAFVAALAFVALLPTLGASADPVEQETGAKVASREEKVPEAGAGGDLSKEAPVLAAIHGGHAPVIHPDPHEADAAPEDGKDDQAAAQPDPTQGDSGATVEEAGPSAAAAPEANVASPAEEAAAKLPDAPTEPIGSTASDGLTPPAGSTGDVPPDAAALKGRSLSAEPAADAAASTGSSAAEPVTTAPLLETAPDTEAKEGAAALSATEQADAGGAAVPAPAPAAAAAATAEPSGAEQADQQQGATGGAAAAAAEPAAEQEESDPPSADANPQSERSPHASSDKAAPQHDVDRPGSADAAFQPSNLLTLPLTAGETVSLYEDIGADRDGWVVRGGYAVASNGDATATVRVHGSWGQTVWEGRGRQSGTWSFKAQRGTLEIQVTNSNPGPAVLTLGWLVGGDKDNAFAQQRDRGETAPGSAAPGGVASGPRISALMDSMSRATAAVHASMDSAQARMQTNAVWMRHNHQTAESTAWRINVWKGTEAVAVLALAVLQVWLISSVARTSLSSFEDPRRRTHKVMSSRFAPRGMV